MGITKANFFTEYQIKLAVKGKALAYPARKAVLPYVPEASTRINSTPLNEFGLTQPNISQHLRERKKAGNRAFTLHGFVSGGADGLLIRF